MSNNSTNKLRAFKNKTHKRRQAIINSLQRLTPAQRSAVCKTSTNAFETFEDKAEQAMKRDKIDVGSASYNLENKIVADLKKAVNPSNIQPNQDYYSYINDRWISSYDLDEAQKYIIQVDDFRIVQDKVYRELIQIIEEYITNPVTKDTKKAICIKNAFTSFQGSNTQEQTRCLASAFAEYMDEVVKEPANLWITLGKANRNEMTSSGTPFVWSLNPDEKNPKIYQCYLEPPQVTLIDIDVYFDDEIDTKEDKKYKNHYRSVYFKYLRALFENCFGENHGFNVKDVFDTEVELINAMSCEVIAESDRDGYNLITKSEAMKRFGFNWEEFCKSMGFIDIPNSFVTSNVNYLMCGTKLFVERWNSPQWKTYWIYLYIRQQSRWDDKGKHLFYEFEGNFVRGQEKIVDPSIRPVFGMGFLFNTFLSNEYIRKYKNEEAINYVKTMAEDLKTVFIRIIKRNKWMQPKTKEKALEKLRTLTLTVGSPVLLREDPLLDYKPNDPWGNLMKITLWRHNRAIKLVGKPIVDIPVMDWTQIPPKFVGTQAYVVNAMYTPTENGIYIPLGYVQKPFVDLDERGVEYNLARIGYTIAHEMSHALDDFGSKYDETGKLNNWWTEKDRKKFQQIQNNIIEQYRVFASYDGIDFDAAPSIGEDLADISGLAICQEYLRDFQIKNDDILPIKALSFRAFFVYLAIQSRQKISKRAILAQLKTNPHPLDKYRCNVPLSRTRVFRAIYKVKRGDKMWWPSVNTVWN
jgi:predicted metalloendopeptidase